LLRELLGQATRDEQDFLLRLLIGELRQGALAGVLLEAIAKASGIPAMRVRRATMLAGDVGVVARAAILEGDTARASQPRVPFPVPYYAPLRFRHRQTQPSAVDYGAPFHGKPPP
jgi:DNA ligase-1